MKSPKRSTDLTRAELKKSHVAAGIEQWGEAERKGLEKQAHEKALETLRVEYDLRNASTEDEKAQALSDSALRQRKAGAPVVYPEFGLEGNS